MTNITAFTKIRCFGYGFIWFNGFRELLHDAREFARRICNPYCGIGADGVALVMPSNKADVRMCLYNPDGSESDRYGNALRAVGTYVFEKDICRREVIRVETSAGIKVVRILLEGGDVTAVMIDRETPVLAPSGIPVTLPHDAEGPRLINYPLSVNGIDYSLTAVGIDGVAHGVLLAPSLDKIDIDAIVARIREMALFPKGAVLEFAEVLSSSRVRLCAWKQGDSIRVRDGGACACAVACILCERTDRSVEMELQGGSSLHVEWNKADDHIYLTAPACRSTEGTFAI